MIDHFPPLINAENISFVVEQKNILQGVNLSIFPDEIVSLVGPNGAGKTSLVRILLRLVRPTEGNISYLKDLQIGYVPQRFVPSAFMPLTVQNFLTLKTKKKLDHPLRLLEPCGVKDLQNALLSELSGGELQRVLLARALSLRPNLLVLDEPTQGIDVGGQAEFYRLLLSLKQEEKFAIFMVSHELHWVMSSTNRVVCLNRHICCEGHPDMVAKHPAFLSLYTHHHDHQHDLKGSPAPEGEHHNH